MRERQPLETVTMHIQAFLQSLLSRRKRVHSNIGLRVMWTVNEVDPETGLLIPKVKRKNLFTNYGLTALASAIGGGYLSPSYLVVSQARTTLFQAVSPGNTSVVLNGNPTFAGDTQLVLSPGTVNQEVVTFSSVNGAGPYTFTLSAPYPSNSHPVNDPVARQVLVTDTMANMLQEAQYDPTYAPNLRAYRAAGYSTGVGEYTMQFYFSGTTLTNVYAMTVGLSDSADMTANNANLHNAVVLGYNHNNTNDVEIDVAFTIINN